MSEKYDEYIESHRANVAKAYKWLNAKLPNIFPPDEKGNIEHQCIFAHDESKYDQDEYEAYDNYFYGNRSYDVVDKFNYAWLAHIHKNPHHWQHWILINDDPEEGEKILDMPDCYIIEMICDWWSFSWKSGDLIEIFDWYEKHSKYMKLSQYTRQKVEDILAQMREKLLEDDNEQ